MQGGGGQSVHCPRRCHRIACAQNHTVVLNFCFDPALNFALGNAVKHGGVWRWRFGPEIAIFGGQIAKILRNRLHRIERFVEPLQSTGESAV